MTHVLNIYLKIISKCFINFSLITDKERKMVVFFLNLIKHLFSKNIFSFNAALFVYNIDAKINLFNLRYFNFNYKGAKHKKEFIFYKN